MFRIGIGNDTHRLVNGRPLVLGGVHIPTARGAEGHSDADALSHAIADAILGALCEGDLGAHFSDREPKLRPYVLSMRENIAGTLGVEIDCVSVKAKTGEGIGSVGQGLAVKAQAVVLMSGESEPRSGSDRVTSR